MATGREPSIGEAIDAGKTVAEAVETGGASLAADPMATARLANEAPKIIYKGIKAQLTCCASILFLAIFVGLFVISLFNPSSGLDDANADTGSSTAGVTVPNTVTKLKVGAKTIQIAATEGKVGGEETVEALAKKGQHITFNGACNAVEKQYYINMRWPYVKWAWDGHTAYINTATTNTKGSYAKKRIIVYNPKTKKSVVTAICESGPAPWAGSTWADQHGNHSSPDAPYWTGFFQFDPPGADGRVAGLAPAAMRAIGAHTNDVLKYGFAEDQGLTPGPIK